MRKIIVALALLGAAGAPASAGEPAGMTGIGVIGGSPFGVTGKYWFNETFAADAGVGYGNAAVFYADALINQWNVIPNLKGGRTNGYLGFGPRVASDDGGQFALRLMAGLGYWPNGSPIELFVELGPTFKVTPDSEIGIDGGVGFRYYFDLKASRAK